ncbi:TetR/AcrR family transcriptional regulator [Nocardia terpenica]|uniref:TetR/AcrR family transcriptional regulator n=1 Tax=Nocardia terpenica TaxID=455432 RepID=UPI001894B827|nr:TetR/AcrR family transcriptional regulator [Nocardia terpenica]MBF6060790.1 TetR/AcrR family transcriptional regulator [Nocardia terpenica]MBF6104050.1 TetR/AcrR family transcriptional regulator [Nocardia terpenica]MBF6111576.1 TetR/AcrR family transcriptional regulator [Nocardia terpenica]MBF6118271.1 TetR/AcrR family transcriptional regulator [Nocardia terpenica]MBF6156104.1 TetR/AcrR family transcriptional regulator [Nocardia terpenica]
MGTNEPATHVRARNPRGEGARLRDEIVAAAVALLDETGEDSAITLRSVARRAGIAAPSIYRHFPDQPAIMLAVVQNAFTELDDQLSAALRAADEAPRSRLLALCHGYLDFARARPARYRTMFGGVWLPELNETSVTKSDMAALGQTTMRLFVTALEDCVAAGDADSTDPAADAVALWLGLHGLAHQRAVAPSFPWPPDIADRVITALAHLTDT